MALASALRAGQGSPLVFPRAFRNLPVWQNPKPSPDDQLTISLINVVSSVGTKGINYGRPELVD
jgi:hypothetical protein